MYHLDISQSVYNGVVSLMERMNTLFVPDLPVYLRMYCNPVSYNITLEKLPGGDYHDNAVSELWEFMCIIWNPFVFYGLINLQK